MKEPTIPAGHPTSFGLSTAPTSSNIWLIKGKHTANAIGSVIRTKHTIAICTLGSGVTAFASFLSSGCRSSSWTTTAVGILSVSLSLRAKRSSTCRSRYQYQQRRRGRRLVSLLLGRSPGCYPLPFHFCGSSCSLLVLLQFKVYVNVQDRRGMSTTRYSYACNPRPRPSQKQELDALHKPKYRGTGARLGRQVRPGLTGYRSCLFRGASAGYFVVLRSMDDPHYGRTSLDSIEWMIG